MLVCLLASITEAQCASTNLPETLHACVSSLCIVIKRHGRVTLHLNIALFGLQLSLQTCINLIPVRHVIAGLFLYEIILNINRMKFEL